MTSRTLEVTPTDPEQRYNPELLHRPQLTHAHAIELTEALLRPADANSVTARGPRRHTHG